RERTRPCCASSRKIASRNLCGMASAAESSATVRGEPTDWASRASAFRAYLAFFVSKIIPYNADRVLRVAPWTAAVQPHPARPSSSARPASARAGRHRAPLHGFGGVPARIARERRRAGERAEPVLDI